MNLLLTWLRHMLANDGEALKNAFVYEELPDADQVKPIPRYKHRWQLPPDEAGRRPSIIDASSNPDAAGYIPHSLEGVGND